MSQSQNEAIRKYLEQGNSLTWLDAFRLFQCSALNSRISTLRNRDKLPIEDKWVTVPSGKRVKEYRLSKSEGQ